MINTEDMKYLEGLVKVRLDDAKREKYRAEISSILDYVAEITSLDLGETSPDHRHKNIFKNDEIKVAQGHIEKAIANSPDHLGNLYKVSKVIKQ